MVVNKQNLSELLWNCQFLLEWHNFWFLHHENERKHVHVYGWREPRGELDSIRFGRGNSEFFYFNVQINLIQINCAGYVE